MKKIQGQTNKSLKMAAKRRSRNNRRRKLRQQCKGLELNGKRTVLKKNKPSVWTELEPQKQKERWETMCLEAFKHLTSWQSEAELNFWKARTEYLQKENNLLKEQIESMEINVNVEDQDNLDP